MPLHQHTPEQEFPALWGAGLDQISIQNSKVSLNCQGLGYTPRRVVWGLTPSTAPQPLGISLWFLALSSMSAEVIEP
jgi:hypothetical protein